MKIISIDIGGTFIKWGVIDKNFKILEKGKFKTDAFNIKTKGILKNVAEKINKLLDKHGGDIKGIGISIAGIVDSKTSKVLTPAVNLPESNNLIIIDELNKYLNKNLPIRVINDATAAALGEMEIGYLKNVNDGILITLGTGIGAGVIINGQIYEGGFYGAGEVGRHSINGITWEQDCSVRSLIMEISLLLDRKDLTGEEIFELKKINPLVNEIYEQWLLKIARGLANIIYILNPTKICLGGGIVQNENFKIEKIDEKLKSMILKHDIYKNVEILKAKLLNDAALYGVASWVKEIIK